MDYGLLSMAWLVIFPEGDDDDTHVVPGFGPPHVDGINCWCEPTRDLEESSVVIHNAVH